MTSGSDLHHLELVDLARRIRAEEVSPVDVSQARLARIQALDGRLRSYALVLAEIARGEVRGPPHGVPIAVKDLCWTK